MNVPLQVKFPSVSSTDDRTSRESRWPGLARALLSWPMPITVGLLLGLVFAIGWVDYLTGLELSVSLLYLIPITIGTWVAGRSMGKMVAFASAGVWLGADLLARHTYGHWFPPVWNTLTLAVSFLVVAALLASLREANEGLEQRVARRTKALQAENAQRRRAEEDLRQALGDVREAHAELRSTQSQLIEAAKMETIGRLAAGVAHEVKNPLMTLSLGVDYFLNRKTEDADEAVMVADMKEAVYRASNIINILLDYTRPRPLQRVPTNLNRLIENSLTLVRQQLNKGRVTVRCELQGRLPAVLLDRSRIEHVLVNLLINAQQAMPEGGTLTVRTSSTAHASNGAVTPGFVSVEIADTGHGIAPEHLEKVFEPFFTTKPAGQGTGLGLSIVRKIMETHGGSISLGNREEGGAKAVLKFNLEEKGTP